MKKTMTIIILSVVALLSIIIGFMAYKHILPIGLGMHTPVYSVKNVALDGYDATSYFEGEPVKGDPGISTSHNGVDWHFSSKEALERFQKNPDKFMPQFGGYCAKAVSTGFAVPADPTVYTIHDDQLFIFSSEDVKTEFMDNPDGLIASCEKKWK